MSARRLVILGATALSVGLLTVFVVTRIGTTEAVDAYVYWSADLADLYTPGSTSGDQTYQYSPAFAQALSPGTALPFEAFHAVWLSAQVALLAWLTGPILALGLVLASPTNVLTELVLGNVHTLIAVSVVAGMRWPAAWAFPILTKVTPGMGLLWFVGRGEWRRAGLALGTTAAITLLSFVLAPDAWFEWVEWLTTRPEPPANPDQLLAFAPLPARLGLAAGLALAAGRLGWAWLLPVAVWLALPIIWFNSLVVLAAAIPLAWPALEARASWLAGLRPPAHRVAPSTGATEA